MNLTPTEKLVAQIASLESKQLWFHDAVKRLGAWKVGEACFKVSFQQ